MSMRLGATLAAAAAGLAVAGCAHTVTVGPSRTLRVALEEYRLNPTSARARAGIVTIYASNFGRLTHNLVVSAQGVQQAAIHPLAPGQSGEVSVVLAPGTYQLGSTLLSDEALGLVGTLHVTR